MYLLLWSASYLGGEGLSTYTVRGEGALREVEDIGTQFVVTSNEKSFVSADKYVTYGEGLRADILLLF